MQSVTVTLNSTSIDPFGMDAFILGQEILVAHGICTGEPSFVPLKSSSPFLSLLNDSSIA
jgi:hypothetical protein